MPPDRVGTVFMSLAGLPTALGGCLWALPAPRPRWEGVYGRCQRPDRVGRVFMGVANVLTALAWGLWALPTFQPRWHGVHGHFLLLDRVGIAFIGVASTSTALASCSLPPFLFNHSLWCRQGLTLRSQVGRILQLNKMSDKPASTTNVLITCAEKRLQ